MLCLNRELQRMIDQWGIERVGFMTLTFADDYLDMKVAKSRWKSLRTNAINQRYEDWIIVWERGEKHGRIHGHLVVVCPTDIKTGNYWQKRGGKWGLRGRRTNNLRLEHEFLNGCKERFGLGRIELLPVRTNVAQVSNYVSKYLLKGIQLEADRGARRIEYRQKNRNYRTNFAWNTAKGYQRRLFVSRIAEDCRERVKDDPAMVESLSTEQGVIEYFRRKFGSDWYQGFFELPESMKRKKQGESDSAYRERIRELGERWREGVSEWSTIEQSWGEYQGELFTGDPWERLTAMKAEARRIAVLSEPQVGERFRMPEWGWVTCTAWVRLPGNRLRRTFVDDSGDAGWIEGSY